MPQKFGRFWLHEKIGHGGMAEIFRASVGPDPDRFAFEVAIKRLHKELIADKSQVDMFLTEADVTKFLDHPNLLHVYEAGFVGEQPYIAMDYVWGIDLGRLMEMLRRRRSRFPADLAVYVTMQVLRGLDYIHRASAPGGEPMQMVHRDVTPNNLYVTFAGDVKIGDFGIAHVRFLEPRDEGVFVKGTVPYIPQEVIDGAPVKQSNDLWGLAVCLFEMLTGVPIEGVVDEDAVRAGTDVIRIPPIRKLNPDIDPQLAAVVDRALHLKARKRPQDASAFYKRLKGYLRVHGIQVGKEALGRFVRAATGTAALVPTQTGPVVGAFEVPAYHSPAGPSLTQQIEVIRRNRRRRVWPAVLGVAVGVAAGLYFLLLR